MKRLLRKVPPSPERNQLKSELEAVTDRVATLPLAPPGGRSRWAAFPIPHSKLGDGTLIDKRDADLHVRFDDGVERWLVADRLTPLGDGNGGTANGSLETPSSSQRTSRVFA